MKAVLLDTPKPLSENPVRVTEMDPPTPGQGQVLIEVTACGVCRSNLHMIEGEWVKHGVPSFSPIVPGHEVVGRIAEVGPGVRSLAVGDRVGVQPLWSTCGRCEFCLTGRDHLCPAKEITGETVHGGYAELMLATEAHTYPLPDGLDDAQAAPLFCPGITAYGAVLKAGLSPTSSVAVFGIGGVGHMVLQIAGLFGGEVVAVSRSPQHLELGRELGATRTVDSSGGDAGAVLAADGGVDASIVFAPSDAAVAQALEATKPGGTVVLGVWASVGVLPFPNEQRVVGSVLGSRQQMFEVLDLAAAGRIRTVCDVYPLEEADRALGDLKRGGIRARAVLTTGR